MIQNCTFCGFNDRIFFIVTGINLSKQYKSKAVFLHMYVAVYLKVQI